MKTRFAVIATTADGHSGHARHHRVVRRAGDDIRQELAVIVHRLQTQRALVAGFQFQRPVVRRDDVTFQSGTNQGIQAEVEPHPTALVLSSTTSDGARVGPQEIPLEPRALLEEARRGGFFSYAAGVAYQVLTNYRVRGLVIRNDRTDLPIKKGLSSSAAISVLTAGAFNRVYDLRLTVRGEMELAYQGEITTPSRCGRMDQGCAFGDRAVLMEFDGDRLETSEVRPGRELHFVIVDLKARKDTVEILKRLSRAYPFAGTEAPEAELLSSFLTMYYEQNAPPEEVLLPVEPDGVEALAEVLSDRRGRRVRILTPRRGAKADLLEVAARNAAQSFRSWHEKDARRRIQSAIDLTHELQDLSDEIRSPSGLAPSSSEASRRSSSRSGQPLSTAARKRSRRRSRAPSLVRRNCTVPVWLVSTVTERTPSSASSLARTAPASTDSKRTRKRSASRAARSSGRPSATILPSAMMTTRLQVALTSGRMCVDRMTVFDWPSSLMSCRISTIWFGSRPLVGSSRMRIGGSWMSACARPTRWR